MQNLCLGRLLERKPPHNTTQHRILHTTHSTHRTTPHTVHHTHTHSTSHTHTLYTTQHATRNTRHTTLWFRLSALNVKVIGFNFESLKVAKCLVIQIVTRMDVRQRLSMTLFTLWRSHSQWDGSGIPFAQKVLHAVRFFLSN